MNWNNQTTQKIVIMLKLTDKMPFGPHKGLQIGLLSGEYLYCFYKKYKRLAPNKRGAFGSDIVKYIEEYRRDVLE